jgi:hypothetical protein
MEKLQFKVNIHAPVKKVYDTMLGLSSKSDYEAWTSSFNPTSSYEGSWNKGSKMLFVGVNDEGVKEGMVSRIVENIPNKFVSIRHYGILKGGQEITEGPDVEKWANSLENYSFEENDGITSVTVELDTTPDFTGYMNETYPKALERLKAHCEK